MAGGPEAESSKSDGPPEGISSFIAKVLDQLSLSAWLPAAVFVSGLVLLAQFHRQKSLSMGTALQNITDDPKVVLILAIPVLVIATIFTQSFSFGAIRILEGYWWRRGPITWLRKAMIRHHVRRRDLLFKRRKEAARDAFNAVRGDLLDIYTYAVVCALERQALELHVPALPTPEEQRKYNKAHWRTKCHAWDLARVEQFEKQRSDYPLKRSRIMPTRLGNVLRSTEDRLSHAGADLEGFAMRRRSNVSQRIQQQHDQFRNRLDMYCTLVFVSTLLSASAIGFLATRVPLWEAAAAVIALTAFSCACYGSAVASARGYSAVLRQMDRDDSTGPTVASAP
jgi:hypothetical protein